jgi:hypothetical protein
MVDMGVLLGDRNHQGKIYAVSRRCLFAFTHRSTKLYPAFLTSEFLDGTSPRIYPWNQSKIANRKSSSPRIYPWGQSKI